VREENETQGISGSYSDDSSRTELWARRHSAGDCAIKYCDHASQQFQVNALCIAKKQETGHQLYQQGRTGRAAWYRGCARSKDPCREAVSHEATILVIRKIIPQSTYEQIKNRIIAHQSTMATTLEKKQQTTILGATQEWLALSYCNVTGCGKNLSSFERT